MKKLWILFYVMLLCFPVVFWSCSCKNPKCECEKCTCKDCTDSCQCCKPDTPIIVKYEVKNAYLYFDNSASMKGYAGDINNYTNVLTDLINAYPSTDVLLCSNDYTPLDNNKGLLIDQVKNLSYGKASLLNKDIETMIEKVKNDSSVVSFLVTDGILSGTDEDISKNREWTLLHVAQLQSDVEKAFRDNPNVAVSIYQFSANFNGKYICYTNTDHNNINAPRNYYVFVIGQKQAVLDFKAKKDNMQHFKPKNQLHFISQHPLTGGVHIKNAKKNSKGEWEYTHDDVKKDDGTLNIAIKDNDFRDELDLAQIKTLAKSIKISPEKGVNSEEIEYDDKNQRYVIPVNSKMFSEQTYEISIPYEMRAWVHSSSCGNDLYMKTRPDERTFLLENLITGIQRGKMTGTDNWYSTSVTLKRVD